MPAKNIFHRNVQNNYDFFFSRNIFPKRRSGKKWRHPKCNFNYTRFCYTLAGWSAVSHQLVGCSLLCEKNYETHTHTYTQRAAAFPSRQQIESHSSIPFGFFIFECIFHSRVSHWPTSQATPGHRIFFQFSNNNKIMVSILTIAVRGQLYRIVALERTCSVSNAIDANEFMLCVVVHRRI